TLTPSASGMQFLSATYVLPPGNVQAVRARFRYQGNAVPCGGSTSTFDDVDDLGFRVGSNRTVSDFDGGGKTDRTVFTGGGNWSIRKSSNNATQTIAWGLSTDKPVPGDYDGDGLIDPAVYRPSDGMWHVLKSTSNYTATIDVQWGLSTDTPVPGDYDGDGRTDFAVYRPSSGTWYIWRSSTNTSFSATWGSNADVPLSADFDGDGKSDIVIFRPFIGGWYILTSSSNFSGSSVY